MKKIIIFGITFYQIIINTFLKNILGQKHFCRFSPTCSDYAKLKIKKEGVLKGGALALTRIFKCNPFTKTV